MKKRAILITAFIVIVVASYAQQTVQLTGIVLEQHTQKPVSFANVVLNSNQRGTCTNEDGVFQFTQLPQGLYKLQVSCLGYQNGDTLLHLSSNYHMVITVKPTSLAIKGVVVTAQETKQNGSTSTTINKETMQHLQPNSLSDVMKLIPGNLTQETSSNKVNLLSIRQVGDDTNTSLGALILVDGIPMSGDANLQTAHSSSNDLKIMDRITTGKGIDLRQIPTDQIESIEVIRGIAPAKYGEVTSGAIIIKQKIGETPLEIRAKKDANTFLFYSGKGVKYGKNIINGGIDYINSKPDPRNTLEYYQRFTLSTRYQRGIARERVSGLINGELAFTGTFDKEKDDPEDMIGTEDSYSASFKRFMARLGGNLTLEEGAINAVDWNISTTQVIEKTKRNKLVSPNGPMPLPISTTEGYSYGIYLPAEYQSYLTIDGRPLNIYATTNLKSREIELFGQHLFSSGMEYRLDWNHGNGEIYDITRPPFPTSASIRPTKSSSIPAIQKASLYIEDNYSIPIGKAKLSIQAGFRGTTLLNAPQTIHELHRKAYIDPRLNASWTRNGFNLAAKPSSISLHAGVGIQTKLPVLAHLYPNKIFFDIVELNYYSQNPDTRSLYMKTVTQERYNPDLKPARNYKMEIGGTLKIGKSTFSITVFEEKQTSGYTTQSRFMAIPYTNYITNSVDPSGLTQPPTVDMFQSEADTMLVNYAITTNGSLTRKQGIEYHLSLGRLEPINTNLTINGAWLATKYDISQPSYRSISEYYLNKPYPYVGIYSWNSGRQKSRFNTNVLIDTHIPAYQLIISLTLQFIWNESFQSTYNNGMPMAYITQNGQIHNFEQDDMYDPMLSRLVKKYIDSYFDKTNTPLNFSANLRVTKSIKQFMSVSFYVDTIAFYQKEYERLGVVQKQHASSSFGAEVNIKI